MHGETMPELRSGTRQARGKAKRVEEVALLQPIEQAQNFPLPASNNRTVRRVGGGRGRGNGTQTAKIRPIAGRGNGIKVIDLDPDRPCEVLPEAPIQIAPDPADKVVAAEEEATTSPIPDRVFCIFFFFQMMLLAN